MNVSGVMGAGGAAGVGAATWSGASRRSGGSGAVGRMQSAITSVAQLLNMQPSQLVSRLGTGQSLASVATSQGISQDTLLSTVEKAVSGSAKQGATPLSGDALRLVASRIAASTSVPAGLSLRTRA